MELFCGGKIMQKRYDTVLLDADNTLLDFTKAEHEALTDCLRKFDLPSDDQTISAYSQINKRHWEMLERGEIEKSVLKYKRFEAFANNLGVSIDAMAISDAYIKALATKSFLIDGAESFCKTLFDAGKTLYIITNGDEYVQHGRFDTSPLKKYFKACFISGEIGYEKPSKLYFEKVYESAGKFDKSSAIVIGDSLTSDVIGGINFGVDTCWYNPNKKPIPDSFNGSPTYTVSNYSEILKIIL